MYRNKNNKEHTYNTKLKRNEELCIFLMFLVWQKVPKAMSIARRNDIFGLLLEYDVLKIVAFFCIEINKHFCREMFINQYQIFVKPLPQKCKPNFSNNTEESSLHTYTITQSSL